MSANKKIEQKANLLLLSTIYTLTLLVLNYGREELPLCLCKQCRPLTSHIFSSPEKQNIPNLDKIVLERYY